MPHSWKSTEPLAPRAKPCVVPDVLGGHYSPCRSATSRKSSALSRSHAHHAHHAHHVLRLELRGPKNAAPDLSATLETTWTTSSSPPSRSLWGSCVLTSARAIPAQAASRSRRPRSFASPACRRSKPGAEAPPQKRRQPVLFPRIRLGVGVVRVHTVRWHRVR